MAKPITPQEMTAYVEATWNKCKKEAWQEAENVWQKAMENALVYGTGFVRFDSMGGMCVVDPKDYHYLEKKEWVGLEDEDVATVKNEFNRGALWAEAKLKEKNT